MFRSHFKIALRNFARNKVFSFINIFGLAVGLATCLLIMLYILDESSYDKHHKDAERLFRVATALKENGDTWAADPAPVAAALKNDLPEVEQVTRLLTFPEMQKMLLRYKNNSDTKQFYETNGYYADSTFFELFTYDFIYGDARTSLNQPNSIVISDQVAQKFFGKENPLDKIMLVGTPMGEFNYTIKGVFNGKKYKSHIPSGFFLSMRNNDMGNWVAGQTNWATTNIFFTYIKLKEGTNPHSFEQKLKPFFNHHAGPDLKAAGITKILFLQPVRDIYLHSSLGNEIGANGNITYLYILGCIAAFILLIACINFMNLSTARSQSDGCTKKRFDLAISW